MPPSKPFSISFGSNKAKPKPIPPTVIKKRPHSALADPDSDHEEHVQSQLVTGFDQSSGGAVSASKEPEKGPLIIKTQANRNWREESRRKRGKNLLPAEVQAAREGANGGQSQPVIEKDEISTESGLQFVKKDRDGDTLMTNGHSEGVAAQEEEVKKERTADEEAIEALLGKEKESTLVIHAADSTQNGDDANGHADPEDHHNENDRYRADVASRPDSCTLEQYELIPVEEFGAAMLRGMGANTGSWSARANGKKDALRVVERRPALLGIGAKEIPGGLGEDLGAWGKAAKGKRKTEIPYSPVMLKNSKTGELLTEEELKKKAAEANQPKEEDDWRDRRDRNLAVDRERKHDRLAIEDGRNGSSTRRHRSRSKERRRHEDTRRDWDYSGDGSRHSSSRRDRSRSPERRRDKESRRDRSRDRDRHGRRRDYDEYDRKYRDQDRRSRDDQRR